MEDLDLTMVLRCRGTSFSHTWSLSHFLSKLLQEDKISIQHVVLHSLKNSFEAIRKGLIYEIQNGITKLICQGSIKDIKKFTKHSAFLQSDIPIW